VKRDYLKRKISVPSWATDVVFSTPENRERVMVSARRRDDDTLLDPHWFSQVSHTAFVIVRPKGPSHFPFPADPPVEIYLTARGARGDTLRWTFHDRASGAIESGRCRFITAAEEALEKLRQ
jgi:hypothetical protein